MIPVTTAPRMPVARPVTGESGALARELGHAWAELARFYRDELGLVPADAARRARGADMTPEEIAADRERLAAEPADQMSWFDLTRAADRDPAEAAALWERLKREARDELATGHRTARALEWNGSPWGRAQFLAIRDRMQGDAPPRDGIEATLLETAAQCLSAYLEAARAEQMLLSTDAERQEGRIARSGRWQPSHVSTAETVAQATATAERLHRRFLRTVAALHDLRRQTPAVLVNRAGPLTIGGQHLYLAADRAGDDGPGAGATIGSSGRRDEPGTTEITR